jgi:hypothetical protein
VGRKGEEGREEGREKGTEKEGEKRIRDVEGEKGEGRKK